MFSSQCSSHASTVPVVLQLADRGHDGVVRLLVVLARRLALDVPTVRGAVVLHAYRDPTVPTAVVLAVVDR
jgi:hypothetical protein